MGEMLRQQASQQGRDQGDAPRQEIDRSPGMVSARCRNQRPTTPGYFKLLGYRGSARHLIGRRCPARSIQIGLCRSGRIEDGQSHAGGIGRGQHVPHERVDTQDADRKSDQGAPPLQQVRGIAVAGVERKDQPYRCAGLVGAGKRQRIGREQSAKIAGCIESAPISRLGAQIVA
jgi:hypothetical protein